VNVPCHGRSGSAFKPLQDDMDPFLKTVVEQAICFIDNKVINMLETESRGRADMFNQATRCADQQIKLGSVFGNVVGKHCANIVEQRTTLPETSLYSFSSYSMQLGSGLWVVRLIPLDKQVLLIRKVLASQSHSNLDIGP
jgi:hypothetical protein